MISTKLTNYFTIFLAAVTMGSSLYAEALTRATLQEDLAYYRKVSVDKKLDTQGRRFILVSIEEKYKNSGINLLPLKAEQRKLNTPQKEKVPAKKLSRKTAGKIAKKTAAPAPVPVPITAGAPASSSAVPATLKRITILDTDAATRITIVAPGAARSNYFLMKDPEPGELPKLVLDLYNTVSSLPGNEKPIESTDGIFARVRAGQFKDPPDPVVRIVADMRRIQPYRIEHDSDTWAIIAEKGTQEQPEDEEEYDESAIAVTAPAPAPAALSSEQPQNSETAAPVQAPEPSPAAAAPAQAPENGSELVAGYRIENGDVLGITVFPADELSREVTVQADGNISFPLIGTAKAKGLTTKQLEGEMAKSLGRYVARPAVTVAVKQFSKRQLFVTGEVRTVGTFPYKSNIRLLDFISSIGGFTENANRKEIKVYRGASEKRQTFVVDLEEVIRSGNFANDFPLAPGDIVEVPQGRARIAVLGDVRIPGYYDYRDNLHLLELVSLAGGFTDAAELTKVRVLHLANDAENKSEIVNLKDILSGARQDFPVRKGDTVYVPKGNIASANWFISNILPWVSLASIVWVVRGGM